MQKRDWLIQKRKSKGLNQTELANLVNVSNKTVSNIELGRKNPSGELALRIARELDFDMELFYTKDSVIA